MSGAQDFPFGIEDVTELLHLKIRRRCSDGVYVDCPFCGEGRGRMKVNYEKDVWRCNYCGEYGGMLALYGKVQRITTSEAYREICDSIQNGIGYIFQPVVPQKKPVAETEPASRAENPVIHQTLTGLLGMLKLSEQHREHLRSVRGLSDEQIERLGYKSTPPFYLCKQLANRLIEQGYTVEGVPGFYQKDGKWTVNFSTMTAGILLPARGIDSMIRGFQIRLDVSLKNDGEKDKPGAKYIWFSSGNKPKGTGAGSPLHFVGDPFARAVYVTEGILKSDVAHLLMNRTFAAIAGINNTAQLDLLFALLAENGTQTIIEAADMDKFRNAQVNKGASAIYLLAKKHGLSYRRLTWNPNYKGIDDWQLAIRKKQSGKEETEFPFKRKFLYGLCGLEELEHEITAWKAKGEHTVTLQEHLGFTEQEYDLYLQNDRDALKQALLSEQVRQGFRIYQLAFDETFPTKAFAFSGIEALHQAGYEQPPAAEYRFVYDGVLLCAKDDSEQQILERIFKQYGDELPKEYPGRSIAPSDVIELYGEVERKYFYRDVSGFCRVQFSPMLAKKKQG